MEGCSLILPAAHADAAVVVAYHGLHYRQPQSCPMLLGGVVRSKKPVTFLRREPCAGIGEFQYRKLLIHHRAEGERASLGHCIDRIKYQIFHHAAQQHGVSAYRRKIAQLQLGADLSRIAIELSLKELRDAAHHLIQINRLYLWRGHFGKIAEAPEIG